MAEVTRPCDMNHRSFFCRIVMFITGSAVRGRTVRLGVPNLGSRHAIISDRASGVPAHETWDTSTESPGIPPTQFRKSSEDWIRAASLAGHVGDDARLRVEGCVSRPAKRVPRESTAVFNGGSLSSHRGYCSDAGAAAGTDGRRSTVTRLIYFRSSSLPPAVRAHFADVAADAQAGSGIIAELKEVRANAGCASGCTDRLRD